MVSLMVVRFCTTYLFQVHIRIASPPIKHPCHMGIHIPTRTELIANAKDAKRLADEVGEFPAVLSLSDVSDAKAFMQA
jgi:glutamine phosphoribosylpyrophosphate amidotransferase